MSPGKFPNKSTAKVSFHEVNDVEQEEIDKILAQETINNKNYAYIKGDFSESLSFAENHQGTNYGGYNFFKNNCMHYAQDVLLVGEFEDSNIKDEVTGYGGPVPVVLFYKIKQAIIRSNIKRGGKNVRETLFAFE